MRDQLLAELPGYAYAAANLAEADGFAALDRETAAKAAARLSQSSQEPADFAEISRILWPNNRSGENVERQRQLLQLFADALQLCRLTSPDVVLEQGSDLSDVFGSGSRHRPQVGDVSQGLPGKS